MAAKAARPALAHRAGLTEAEIVSAAKDTRRDHPEPPDGPKALDRAMQRAAQRKTDDAGRKRRRRKSDPAPAAKPIIDLPAFYANLVNADGFLPVSAISNTMRDATLGRGLVTPERLCERGDAVNGMVSRPGHGLSLCAGGGLGLGLMLAEPGYHSRAFVEWEAYPRSVVVGAQRAGYFAAAPIWDDLRSFDARLFRGAFDTVLAGYPCQPFSAAGKRGGADDPRHLWPEVARVIGECRPEQVFVENVSGHVTLGLETVLRELWGMGYTPAAGLFSAAEVGAPHQRLRIFILAHTDEPASGHGRLQPGRAKKIVLRHAVPDHQHAAVVVGNDPADLTTVRSAKVDQQKETCGCSGILRNHQHRAPAGPSWRCRRRLFDPGKPVEAKRHLART